MGCHYCNFWAGRKLSEKAVCEDCYQTVHAVPDEERVGVLTERLQKVHGMLLKHPQQGYVEGWVKDLASRIEYLSRLSSDPGIPAPTLEPEVIVRTPVEEVSATRLPKPLKIRKLR